MKLATKPFLSSLESIAHLSTKRSTCGVLNCVKLETVGGALRVSASDLESFGRSSCVCDGEIQPVCVSAHALLGFAKAAGDELELLQRDTKLSVRGNGTANLAVIEAEEFPKWPSSKAKAVGVNTIDLANAIDAVHWAAEPKEVMGGQWWSTAVWVKITDKTIQCAATNGKICCYTSRPSIAAPVEFCFQSMHAKSFAEALRTDGAILSVSENYAIVEASDRSIAVKLWDLKYPNIVPHLAQERQEIGTFEREPLLNEVSTILMLAEGEHASVDVSFSADGIVLDWAGTKHDYHSVVPATVVGDSFRMNAKYLHDALKNTGTEDRVAMSANAANILIKSGDSMTMVALMKRPEAKK